MLALGGEFDHGRLAQVPDLQARGGVATFLDEFAQALTRGAQLLAKLAIGDLEAAHSGAVLFGVVGGGSPLLALELGPLHAGGADLLVQRAPFARVNGPAT